MYDLPQFPAIPACLPTVPPVDFVWESLLIVHKLLKDRAVWGSLGIALTFNMAWTVQNEYFYTVLRVGFLQGTKSSTRIANLYSFTSVIVGALVGLLVYKFRHLKPFIFAGTVVYGAATALLVVFSGGGSSRDHWGVTGAQVMLGVSGGMFPYLTMASIQAATMHEHLAVITGLYFATYRVGAAIGACVAAAVWV